MALILAVLTVVLAVVFLAMTPLSPSIHVHKDSRVEDVIAVRPYFIPGVSGALLITGMFTAGCAVIAWMVSRTRRMGRWARAAALTVTLPIILYALCTMWIMGMHPQDRDQMGLHPLRLHHLPRPWTVHGARPGPRRVLPLKARRIRHLGVGLPLPNRPASRMVVRQLPEQAGGYEHSS